MKVIEYRNEKLSHDMLSMLYKHLGNTTLYNEYVNAMGNYDVDINEYRVEEWIGFICVFKFPHLHYDVLLSASTDDKFNKAMFKQIRSIILSKKEEGRTLVIPSTEGNAPLVRATERLGGEFKQGDAWFNFYRKESI